MNIGQMRDRITFLKKEEQTGAVVNLDGNYTDYATVWAKVEYFSSKEIYSANAINVLNSLKFIIRYRTDIDNAMRIRFDNNIYKITGIRPLDNKKMYMLIIAEQIENELAY
jgi:SPP1 family predicted phage head-tail adaptor